MGTLIVQCPQPGMEKMIQISRETGGRIVERGNWHEFVETRAVNKASRLALGEQTECDINALPDDFDPCAVRLLVTDMDSTLINIECVDEIADFAGRKAEVAAITEAAMRGELDFAQSLTRRVAELVGLDSDVLQKVYEERLELNPGAERLIAGLKAQGIKVALVSGGFTYFTDRLKERLGLDYTLANVLETDGQGRLTGRVSNHDGIVGAERKRDFLLSICEELGISPRQAVALGDGANDLKMMEVAGLGVAYRAKPKVQAEADCALNHCGLDGVLGLLGIG